MQVDRRLIFIAVALTVGIFLYFPLPCPMPIDPEVRKYFEAIESLPKGSVVVVSTEYSPSTEAEQWCMHENTLYHLFVRGIRVISISTWETGNDIAAKYIRRACELVRLDWGKEVRPDIDYAELAYTTGREIVMVAAANSITEAFPRTCDGRPSASLPALKGVKGLAPDPVTGKRSVAFLIDFASGNPGTREWIRMVGKRYNVPILAGVTSVMAPDLYPFIRSGQVKGLLAGLPGSYQYELLLRRHGIRKSRSTIDSDMTIQSAVHFLIIGLVLIGNLGYLLTRKRRRR